MEKEKKTKKESKETKESCCADSDTCSIDCSPKSKKKDSKCGCGGYC